MEAAAWDESCFVIWTGAGFSDLRCLFLSSSLGLQTFFLGGEGEFFCIFLGCDSFYLVGTVFQRRECKVSQVVFRLYFGIV